MEAVAVKSQYETERGKPMPSKNHSIIQDNLHYHLRHQYGKRYRFMPEISVVISGRERVPDIGVYPFMEFSAGEDEIRMATPPLCAIEILSPTQDLTSLIGKSTEYFTAGVKSYWLVLPDLLTIYVFNAPGEYQAFTQNDERLVDEELGIELELKAVFK